MKSSDLVQNCSPYGGLRLIFQSLPKAHSRSNLCYGAIVWRINCEMDLSFFPLSLSSPKGNSVLHYIVVVFFFKKKKRHSLFRFCTFHCRWYCDVMILRCTLNCCSSRLWREGTQNRDVLWGGAIKKSQDGVCAVEGAEFQSHGCGRHFEAGGLTHISHRYL